MRVLPRSGTAIVGAATLLLTSLIPLTAHAADGPPPTSDELRVLSRLHTDAVSTFLTGDTLELATKADVPEGNGTRLDPTQVLFHVDDAAQLQVPAGFEFIAPEGSTVWMAPETNPSGPGGYTQLWPGFSTESIASGVLQGDQTTFTLTSMEGPGDLELFTSGALGQPKRLWSSDEGLHAFTVGRTHMHANWAFTAAGTYTLRVQADATTAAGTPLTAQNTYTFVVGPMADPVTTSTTLTADSTTVDQGAAVNLSATVTPTSATGWVEFLDGDTTLGHTELTGGTAAIQVSSLGLGERSLTARFVPALLNDFGTSTSDPVTVTVSEPGGQPFGIGGFAPAYAAGDQIHLRPQGVTPAEGQSTWWLIRKPGEIDYLVGQNVDFVRDATTALDGTQIALVLRGPVDGKQTILQQSAWSTFQITGENVGSGDPIAFTGLAADYYIGDPITLSAEHAPLADGQTYQWVSRVLPYSMEFYPLWDATQVTGDNPFVIDTAAVNGSELALRILDADGTVVGQSPAISPTLTSRELLLSGARSVYRDGETLDLSSELFPTRTDLRYQWGTGSSYGFTPWDGRTSSTLSMPVTTDLDGSEITLRAVDATTGFLIAESSVTIRVTTVQPGEQLVLLDALAEHYHQNNTIALRATADPIAGDTDSYTWQWQLPGTTDWDPIPGAEGASHDLTAEQALDGTPVRAQLRTADGELLATSETITIHVDDHGAKPVQKATVNGLAASYQDGDPVRLTAAVSPASVLDRWEWYLQRPGSDTPALLEDTLTSSLEFDVTEDLDGAAIFARLTYADGRAYVESAPVILSVESSGPGTPEPTDPGTPQPEPTDPGTPQPEPTDPGTPEPTEPGTPEPTEPGMPAPTDPGTPRPNPGKPAAAPAARTGDDLSSVVAGGVTPSVTAPRQGQVISVQLGAEHANEWVAAWMFSTPTLLGGDWVQADATGTVAVRIPADAPAGAHRIAVYAADGTLIGWSAIQVAAADGTVPTDRLAVTGSSPAGALGLIAGLLVVGAGALVLSRRRSAQG